MQDSPEAASIRNALKELEAEYASAQSEIKQERETIVDLKEDRAELQQTTARLEEQIAAAQEEFDSHKEELADYEAKAASARSLGGGRSSGGQSAGDSTGQQDSLPTVSPADAVEQLLAGIGALRSRVSGDEVNCDPDSIVSVVAITNKANGKQQAFHISPHYTFEELTLDACSFWGISRDIGSLRDRRNRIFSTSAQVQKKLSESKETVDVILHVRNTATEESKESDKDTTLAKRSTKSFKKVPAVEGGMRYDMERFDPFRAKGLELSAEKKSLLFHEASLLEGHTPNYEPITSADADLLELTADTTNFIQVAMHLAFWLLITTSTLAQVRVFSQFEIKTSIQEGLGRPFLSRSGRVMDFNSMRTHSDVFRFLEGPLLNTLFPSAAANGDVGGGFSAAGLRVLAEETRRTVGSSSRLVGGVRLRQLRTDPVPCTLPPTLPGLKTFLKGTSPLCYGDYSLTHRSTKAFGADPTLSGFTFAEGFVQNSLAIYTTSAWYDKGGFTLEIPGGGGSGSSSAAILAKLETNGWLDSSSRMLFVEFNVQNPNLSMLLCVRLQIEMSNTGSIQGRSYLRVMRPSLFQASGTFSQRMLAGIDFASCVFVLLRLYVHIVQMLLVGISRHFKTMWNLAEVLLLLLSAASVAASFYYEYIYTQTLDLLVPHYVNYWGFVDWTERIFVLKGFCIVLGGLVTLKFLQRNQDASLVFKSLQVAAGPLINMALVFLVLGAAMATVGYMSFGSHVKGFSSIMACGFEILRFCLTGKGSTGFKVLHDIDRTMASIYSLGNLFIFVFMANLIFIAILAESYRQAATFDKAERKPFFLNLLTAPARSVKYWWTSEKA